MNKTIGRRLVALESGWISDPIILHMPDGSTVRLVGGRDLASDLLHAAISANGTPEQRRQLELIAQSESSEEPGGARLIELLRAFVNGPVEPAI